MVSALFLGPVVVLLGGAGDHVLQSPTPQPRQATQDPTPPESAPAIFAPSVKESRQLFRLQDAVTPPSAARGEPRVLCGLTLWPVDPDLDSKMRVPSSDRDVDSKIRRVVPSVCHDGTPLAVSGVDGTRKR